MNREITHHITFAQAVSPAVAAAVQQSLPAMLAQLHAAGGIHRDDVIYAAGKAFRVAKRSWDLNDGKQALELTLVPA